MKAISFLGNSLDALREFPSGARQTAGYQLDKIQHGNMPDDWKSMPSIGPGVQEIRIQEESGTFRVIYTAKLGDAVYVLHAFQKKTRRTAKHDIDLAKQRFKQLIARR